MSNHLRKREDAPRTADEERAMIPEEGIYDIDWETYRNADAINQSLLQKMMPTPAHCKAYIDGEIQTEEKKHFSIGRWAHTAMEDIEDFKAKFNERFAVRPSGLDLRTKEGKAWAEQNKDKTILTAQEGKFLLEAPQKIKEHPFAKNAFANCRHEISAFAEHEETGLRRKARIDCLPGNGNAIVDMKTSRSASPRDFALSAAKFGYHIQAAFYYDVLRRLGLHRPCFVFFVVETDPPFEVAVYQLSDRALQVGLSEMNSYLELYKECLENGVWPGYTPNVQVLDLPEWRYRQEDYLMAT